VITYRFHRLEILAVDGWWHPGTVGAAGHLRCLEGEALGRNAWAKARTYFNGTAT
jgi:hypothetical protein